MAVTLDIANALLLLEGHCDLHIFHGSVMFVKYRNINFTGMIRIWDNGSVRHYKLS